MTHVSIPLWRDRNFVVFWVGQALSVLGDGFASVATPLLVLRATGSVTQMGAITATIGVGRLVAALFAGMIADRWDRRGVMIFCDVLRALLWTITSAVFFFWGPSIPWLFVVAAISSFTGNIFHVACFAALPSLVGRERIVTVNSWLWGTYAFMGFVGPMFGGFACARFGPVVGIGVDGASFLASAISIALVTFRKTESSAPESKPPALHGIELLRASLGDGLAFIWRTPILRTMALGFIAIRFLAESRTDLVIYQLEHDLGADADRVGLVLGLASVGAVGAGIGAQRILRRFGPSGTWMLTSSLASLPVIALGWTGQLKQAWPIALLLLLISFGEATRGILSQSLRHQVTPDAALGRVTSAFWAICDLPGALGAFVMTAVATRLGTSVVFVVAGMGAMIAASWAGSVLQGIDRQEKASVVEG